MALHDAYARRTPYELTFPDLGEARACFESVDGEAGERGVDPLHDPDGFVMLQAVGEALRDLRAPAEDPQRIREHGRLLWYGYRFWKAGETPTLLNLHAARYLLDAGPSSPWDGTLPEAAGYLQLPRHLVWVREDEQARPQSLDGFFWADRPGELYLLLVLGVLEERPGFSVVSLERLPLEDAEGWASLEGRPGGRDFQADIPGAELDDLKELRTGGEALKLAARALRHAAALSASPVDPPEVGDGPTPTSLSYRAVGLT